MISASPVRELFVYYRVPVDLAEEARGRVLQMQAGLCERHAGLQARLLRRPGDAAGLQTWMETYAWPERSHGIADDVQSEIERAASVLAPWHDGPRHAEVFEPL